MPNDDHFPDRTRWQTLREQLSGSAMLPGAAVGILRKESFASRSGKLVVLHGAPSPTPVLVREYSGEPGADVAVLLVVDFAAVDTLQDRGLTAVRALARQGKVLPYMLKTMEQLEAAGMADLIEDLGLTFPTH